VFFDVDERREYGLIILVADRRKLDADWEITFNRRISSNGLRVFLHCDVTLREKARREAAAKPGGEDVVRGDQMRTSSPEECGGFCFLVGWGAGGRPGGRRH